MGDPALRLVCGFPELSHTAAEHSHNPSFRSEGQPGCLETEHSQGDQHPGRAAASQMSESGTLSLP